MAKKVAPEVADGDAAAAEEGATDGNNDVENDEGEGGGEEGEEEGEFNEELDAEQDDFLAASRAMREKNLVRIAKNSSSSTAMPTLSCHCQPMPMPTQLGHARQAPKERTAAASRDVMHPQHVMVLHTARRPRAFLLELGGQRIHGYVDRQHLPPPPSCTAAAATATYHRHFRQARFLAHLRVTLWIM